ncbi:MAG: winged helix-turn-helix domain-containing protein [Croceibacterium sp.]
MQPHRQLLADGEHVHLGKRALDILSVLAEASGEIVTKDELLAAVWPGVIVEENALQVHIVALRKALGPEAERLKTFRGVGYQLDVVMPEPLPSPSVGPALPRDPPTAAPLPSISPHVERRLAWPVLRRRWPLAAVVLVVVALALAWLTFDVQLGLRPEKRIPIVVRQLTATSGADSSEAALARGLTDELIDRLRRSPQLRIGTANPDGSISGEAFKRAYVVEGGIRRDGAQLRVTARLLGSDGDVLLSQTFQRPLADIFTMQEQIAAAIGGALRVSLDIGTDSRAYGGTNDPEAYAAYLQGAAHLLDRDYTIPERNFQRAIALDPHFVKAFSALSVVYGVRVERATSAEQARKLLVLTDISTRKAIEANPKLGTGYQARAWFEWHRRDLLAADRNMRRMVALDKADDPALRSQLVPFNIQLGRTAKAMELSAVAETADPINRNEAFRVWGLLDERKYQEAIDQFDRLDALGQGGPVPAQSAFWAHLFLRGEADAERFSKQHQLEIGDSLLELSANPALPKMTINQLRDWAHRQFGDARHDQLAFLAVLAGYRHQPQLAVRLLQLAFERSGGFAISLFWSPALAEVRKTPEFKKFLIDFKVVDAWRESGDWGDYCRPISAADFACS